MEQKKILWILFAVTLFLLVVVGAGFIWFYPGAEEPREQTAAVEGAGQESEAREFDPIEWVRSSEEYPGLKEDEKKSPEDENFVVVYGQDEPAEDGEGEQPAEAGEPEVEEAAEEREPSAAGEAAAPSREEKRQSAAEEKQVPEKTAAPEESGQERKRYEGTQKTIRTVEYWIQAGSYTSKTRAEEVREELRKKGFASRITVKEIEGTLYYRVRIGPYAHKEEAEKFLRWVKDIDKFEKSYVSKVYSEKRVAN
jgi:cell division protein FtsN